MKNNRQIGLDGKIFITDCLKRSTYFIYGLLLFGAVGALSDILKLLGAGGTPMSTFTVTLLMYDFISLLLLIIVVFYAHYLECGSNIPILKEKPVIVLCWMRMGYNVLLGYYVCYRVMYTFAHPGEGLGALSFYYIAYLVIIILSIFSETFIINILSRNIVRRSYEKSFHRLSSIGIVAQALLPIAYLFVRIFYKDVGDEFFTSSFCDLLRLCITPILYTSLWFIYVGAVKQVGAVFNEVDTALREKRYQITYSEPEASKKLKAGKKNKKNKKRIPKPAAAAGALAAPTPVQPVEAPVSEEETDTEDEDIKIAESKDNSSDEDQGDDNDNNANTDTNGGEGGSSSGDQSEESDHTADKQTDTEESESSEPSAEDSAAQARIQEAMRIRNQVHYASNPSVAGVQDFNPYAVQNQPVRPAQPTQQTAYAPRPMQNNQRLPQNIPNGAYRGQPNPHRSAARPNPAQKNQRTSRAPRQGGSVYYPPHNPKQ